MLHSSVSALLGVIFVLLGAVNVWLMFHASKRLRDRRANALLIGAHRVSGYLFILLFCVMTYFMLLKIRDMPDELSARPMVHMLLAVLLVPLLFIKVLIARYYKSYSSVLMPIGLGIFAIAFVLVAMATTPYFARRATIRNISMESVHLGTHPVDLQAAQQLTEKRCAHCHNLDRVFGARKDAGGWLSTINRMRALPGSGISESDGTMILSFLVAENSIDSSTPQGDLAVGKALVDTHCNRCHGLDRTYATTKSPEEWRETVARMVGYARGTEGFFKPGEDEGIIRFLAATQTPQAAENRRAQIKAAIAKNDSLVSASPGRNRQSSFSPDWNPRWTTLGVIAALSATFGMLLLRRPMASGTDSAPLQRNATAKLELPRSTDRLPRKSLVLHLVRVERQAQGFVTLRFRVSEQDRFHAKPGQFLTFTWLVDGEKAIRSYSICSSPTQIGYVEIAVKRVENGYISVFLNDRAAVGLTVEAKGPSGRFSFDENQQQKIVLIAAGSGITPMLSMLRYIDDRCLLTEVTLLYSVRTRRDIFFHQELERLRASMHNFQYVVTLTEPDKEWTGPRGRLSKTILEQSIPDLTAPTFFLCGPEGFMESAKESLTALGVDAGRIKQERFGGKASISPADPSGSIGEARFVRSNHTCPIPPGSTLLEIAESHGIPIRSSCRQGQCGTCVVKLLEGQVSMDVQDGLEPDLKDQGYVLACVGRAAGDVAVDA